MGNTPLVRLQRLPGRTSNVILAKLEGDNPAGSVKDRCGTVRQHLTMEAVIGTTWSRSTREMDKVVTAAGRSTSALFLDRYYTVVQMCCCKHLRPHILWWAECHCNISYSAAHPSMYMLSCVWTGVQYNFHACERAFAPRFIPAASSLWHLSFCSAGRRLA